MKDNYKIALSAIVDEFHFEVVVKPEGYEDVMIQTPEVNRPGLALAGFFGVFEPERIQLIGKAETQYLQSLEPSTKRVVLQNFVDAKPVAILYTTGLPVDEALLERAQLRNVPVLRTQTKTSPILSAASCEVENG